MLVYLTIAVLHPNPHILKINYFNSREWGVSGNIGKDIIGLNQYFNITSKGIKLITIPDIAPNDRH